MDDDVAGDGKWRRNEWLVRSIGLDGVGGCHRAGNETRFLLCTFKFTLWFVEGQENPGKRQ